VPFPGGQQVGWPGKDGEPSMSDLDQFAGQIPRAGAVLDEHGVGPEAVLGDARYPAAGLGVVVDFFGEPCG
jgi:hypothetical protein